jgi:hypothetical protein
MTDSRVTSDQHDIAGKRVLAVQLTVAIFSEN